VITSFPSRWSYGTSGDDLDPKGRTDIFENIKRNIHDVKCPEALVQLVMSECLRACFDPDRHLGEFPDPLNAYSSEIGRIVRQLSFFTRGHFI